MNIVLLTPAKSETRSGNWVTASRWQGLLNRSGYSVSIVHDPSSSLIDQADLLIGLHARRSGSAITRFKKKFPDRYAIIALTGTDLYRDLSPDRQRPCVTATTSLDRCDQIILLQPLMAQRLRPSWRQKSYVVMMDTPSLLGRAARTISGTLNACVVGHLRPAKDALRAAMAVRRLPVTANIQVTHAGRALSDSMERRALHESHTNPNWNWIGSVNRSGVNRLMRQSDVLVNSSRVEGAPNVLFESISFGLPVIASKIDGHVGVLGEAYPGYFEVGDTRALRAMLIRCFESSVFYDSLCHEIVKLQDKYRPGSEQLELQKAISSVLSR